VTELIAVVRAEESGAAAGAGTLVPAPRCPVTVRPATPDDLPFIDSLQKQYNQQVGYFRTKVLEGYLGLGGIVVAESVGRRVGYCISRDRYHRRDELGIIYHLCVAPVEQRKLIGAALIKAVFERSAYGCKLYCCWCAQDIAANYFWESIGFVPIAFRAGSQKKGRVHIFWQKRIREGDTTTPYWFPATTSGGAIGEERLALPIPPGTHWSDAKPIVLPGLSGVEGPGQTEQKQLPDAPRRRPRKEPAARTMEKHVILSGGLRYVPPGAVPAPAPKAPTAKVKKPRVKHDPRYLVAARELRDRYLEHVNSGQLEFASGGKYDVTRQLISPTTSFEPKLIAAA
jgi:GNAT superfamily N-acetyltransferase